MAKTRGSAQCEIGTPAWRVARCWEGSCPLPGITNATVRDATIRRCIQIQKGRGVPENADHTVGVISGNCPRSREG